MLVPLGAAAIPFQHLPQRAGRGLSGVAAMGGVRFLFSGDLWSLGAVRAVQSPELECGVAAMLCRICALDRRCHDTLRCDRVHRVAFAAQKNDFL